MAVSAGSVESTVANGLSPLGTGGHATAVAMYSHGCGAGDATAVGGVTEDLKARTGAVIPDRHDHQGSAHPPPPRCDRERR